MFADFTSILQYTANKPWLAIILALLLVASSGAAWKFWTKFSALKHQENMKELETEEKIKLLKAETDAKIKLEEALDDKPKKGRKKKPSKSVGE